MMNGRNASMVRNAYAQQGLSLIELMIALLLGTIVVVAASAVFLSNKRVYGTSETVGRLQENERTSFELMSRDLREAGGNPCSTSANVVSQLKSGDNTWWTNWGGGLRGYGGNDTLPGTVNGSGAGERVAGTDAVDISLANDGNIRVVQHDNPSANLMVNSVEGIATGDILLVCNMDYAFTFEVTQLNSAGGIAGIQHNGGSGGGTTGNCANEFQHVRDCSPGASGTHGYCFMVPNPTSVNPNCDKFSTSPASISRVTSSRWYIGNNGRGGRSLYRATVRNTSGTNTPNLLAVEEIAEGVTGMVIRYLSAGSNTYQAASAVANWSQVTAARVDLTFEGTEGALSGSYIQGTDGAALNRRSSNMVALRNRESLL